MAALFEKVIKLLYCPKKRYSCKNPIAFPAFLKKDQKPQNQTAIPRAQLILIVLSRFSNTHFYLTFITNKVFSQSQHVKITLI
jgi:hypothetical protein